MPLLTEQGARYAPIRKEDHWFRGEDKKLVFKVTDETGAVPNFAGWETTWYLKDRVEDDDNLLALDGSVVNGPDPEWDPADGPTPNIDLWQVTIASVDTLTLRTGTFAHALVRTDTGNRHVLSFGEAELQATAGG